MINFSNNPIQDVVDICGNLYPDINCNLTYAEGIKERDDAWAATVWPDDGSTPQIWIDVSAPYSAVIELIAHEFAHVVAGEGAGHNEKWDGVFSEIHESFNQGDKNG